MKNRFFLISILALLIFLFLWNCSPRGTLSQMNFGIQAAEKELWDEAIFRWKKVIELNPDSAAAHNNLAVAYEKKGMWEEARKEYRRALDLDPDNEYIQSNFDKFQSNHSGENVGEKKDEKNQSKK